MLLLDKKWYRDLLTIKGRIIALILIIACGVAIFFGIGQAFSNLIGTQDKSLANMNFADVEVRMLPEDLYNLPDLTKIDGVKSVETRLIFPANITTKSNQTLAALLLFNHTNQPKINKLQLLQGRYFKANTNEVVIDKALAKYHNYNLDDEIKIKAGQASYTYKIVGIVNSAEFLVTAANPDYIIARPGSLGVVWADISHINQALGFTMINSILFKTSTAEALFAINNSLKRFNIERIIPKQEAYSYKMIKLNINALSVYTPAIVITLCILSIAMGFLTFKRFIIEKQQEIGVLLAIGISQKTILYSLLRIAFLIGISANVIGLIIGWSLGVAFAKVYANAMHLSVVFYEFNTMLAIKANLIGLLSSLGGLYLAVKPLLNKLPVDLINFRDENLAKNINYYNNLLTNLKSKNTIKIYAIRNILRDKFSSIASILAMSGSIAVAIAYSLAMHSTFSTVEHGFVQEKWTHAIDFDRVLYAQDAQEILQKYNIKNAESYYRTSADIYANTGKHVVALVAGIHMPSIMRKIELSQGRLPNKDNESILSSDLAKQLNIKVGDNIRVEKGNEKINITVVGFTSNMFLYTLTLPIQTVQNLALNQDKYSGYYVNINAQQAKLLEQESFIARITNKMQLVNFFSEEMQQKMGLVYITIIFSLSVSILFVSTLICLNIIERRQEYTILRALGFKVKYLQNIIFTTTFIQVLLSLILAIPLSYIIVYFLNQRMEQAWFKVDLYSNISSFIYPMLAIIIVSPLVAYLSTKHILNINIPDFLRGRSI